MLKEEFLRLLREDPAFREEVRRQLLADDIRFLSNQVEYLRAEMYEAFRRLAEAIERLEAQVAENSRQIAALTERMDRVEAQIAENSRQIAALVAAVRDHSLHIGNLKGRSLEAEWVRKAPAYLGRWFRRVRVLEPEVLHAILDDAEAQGILSREEVVEILSADLVVEALNPEGVPVRVLVEVSWTVGVEDVRRARERADLLARLGVPVVAIAAGTGTDADVRAEARVSGVWLIEDGRRTVGGDS